MKKRTNHKKGYNKPELENEHPELAAAFYYLLLKNKGSDPKFQNLWINYIGKYKHHKTQTVRRVHLERILEELKGAGFEINYSVTLNGQSVTPDLSNLSPDEMLLSYLGRENLKLANKMQKNLFKGRVFQVDDYFYSIIKQGEELPALKNKNKEQVIWETPETIFTKLGFQILKAKAKPEYFFRTKQTIRY